jgi:CBS domain-containing membrane protein
VHIKTLFQDFKPDPDFTTLGEKIKSALAAAAGIFLLGLALKFFPQIHYPTVMLASMAASAVLLYAAQHSPMAQPWPLIGGHLVSAICGWLVVQLISDQLMAASLAVGVAILAMSLLRCLHPPGAATALIMVLSFESFRELGGQWVGYVVLMNTVISLLAAITVNNLLPGRRYPLKKSAANHGAQPLVLPKLSRVDIERALEQMDSVIDVSEEDLLTIYELASKNAGNGMAVPCDHSGRDRPMRKQA